jgi:murein DD-endopeptidase MepM/ murein hydrolase activator NlpD
MTPQRPTHKGIDMAPIIKVDGIQLIATIDGVARSGYDKISGNYIIVQGGIYQVYVGHLKRFIVKSGTVKIGQVIGIMGSTGSSTAMHVHVQVKRNNKIINPYSEMNCYGHRMEITPILGGIIRQSASTKSAKIGKLNWRTQFIVYGDSVVGESVRGNNRWWRYIYGGYVSDTVLKEVG